MIWVAIRARIADWDIIWLVSAKYTVGSGKTYIDSCHNLCRKIRRVLCVGDGDRDR